MRPEARPESSDATEVGEAISLAAPVASADATEAGEAGPEPARQASAPARQQAGGLARGEQIGRYLVLGRVGRGGMGEVYAAHDPELDRKVALKLLHLESDHGEGRARTRMLREAQAMARLVHPNTLTVHDVGEHGGRVFLAMEFIEGETLGAWLAKRARSWREVLPIFVAAGKGLAAAHGAGLVHRDFKPDNVMLADDGRVLVMDFGLARAELAQPELDGSVDASALGEDLEATLAVEADTSPPAPQKPKTARLHVSSSALSTSVTQVGALLGTPAYMAPEQLRGQVVDARADQWAYCVAFYEALYGQRPFPTSSLADLIGAVLGSPPLPPPPSRSAPNWLHRIILRGLSRKPEDRWPSLDALLLELDRQPRRRRQALWLVGAGVSATLIGLLAWASREEPPLPCQGGRDEIAEVWNDAVRHDVEDALLSTRLPYAADTWARVEQDLDGWATRWADEHREACEATELRREQSSDLLDLRMQCLAERKRSFSALVDALGAADPALVEHAVTMAQELPSIERCADPAYVRARVPPPEDRERAEAVEQIRDELATLAQSSSRTGTPEELAASERLRERAVALEHPPLLAEIDALLGMQLNRAGQTEPALAALRRAYFTARRAGDDPQAILAGTLVVFVLGNHASRPADALSFAEHVQADVDRVGSRDDRAELLNSIGLAQHAAGDYEAAERSLNEALELWRAELDETHVAVAAARLNLGRTLRARGQWARAREQLEQALAVQTELFGPAHPELCLTLDQLGLVASQVGDLEQAQLRFDRSLEIRTAALPPTHPQLAYSLGHVGRIAFQRGRYEDALSAWERALRLAEQTQGTKHADVAAAHSNVGVGLRMLGRYDEAQVHYQQALEIYERSVGIDHADTAIAVHNLGNLVGLLGQHERSLELQDRAIAAWEAQVGPEHILVAHGMIGKARALLGLGRYAEAIAAAERGLSVLEGSGTSDVKLAIEASNVRAAGELGLGRRERARDLAEGVLEEIEEQGPDAGLVLERARARVSLAGALPEGEQKDALLGKAREDYASVPGPALAEAVAAGMD